MKYYWAGADRFAADNFVPTKEDYFKARIKTTGIVESTFSVNGTNFTIVDVGGQRSERKKWLHCFGSVDAIIFLAYVDPSLSFSDFSVPLMSTTWFWKKMKPKIV